MALPFFEHLFYAACMIRPDPDRLRYAQIAGAAARHALGWRLTADEEAVAVTELAQAAAGRADLLAERAGTALGFGEGRPDAARYRQIAELCIAAGADQALIDRWIKVGRERAAVAAAIPYTGLPPGGLTAPDARQPADRSRRSGALGCHCLGRHQLPGCRGGHAGGISCRMRSSRSRGGRRGAGVMERPGPRAPRVAPHARERVRWPGG